MATLIFGYSPFCIVVTSKWIRLGVVLVAAIHGHEQIEAYY